MYIGVCILYGKSNQYKKTRPGCFNKEGTQFYIISILRQNACQTVEKDLCWNRD